MGLGFWKSLYDVFIKIMMTVLTWGVEVVVELLNIKMFLTIFWWSFHGRDWDVSIISSSRQWHIIRIYGKNGFIRPIIPRTFLIINWWEFQTRKVVGRSSLGFREVTVENHNMALVPHFSSWKVKINMCDWERPQRVFAYKLCGYWMFSWSAVMK